MKKGKKLYEGKAKIIFATEDKNLVIQHFKDDATAYNNQIKDTIEGNIVFQNVSFTYPGKNEPVFDNLNINLLYIFSKNLGTHTTTVGEISAIFSATFSMFSA